MTITANNGDQTKRRDGRHDGTGTPRLRVLVVEDDTDTAQTLAWLLDRYGFEVQTAAGGEAALTWARANQPDVVLLDIGLPDGMDGHEVARELQTRAGEKTPLLVAITGRGRKEDCRRSEEAGIHLHLTKPVDPEELRLLLERFQTIISPRPVGGAVGSGQIE